MIAGLQQPWSGEIRIGGVGAQRLAQARRSQVIGYVDQEVFLFEGSVRDNLTLWDDTIPQDALISALSDAAILDDVLMRWATRCAGGRRRPELLRRTAPETGTGAGSQHQSRPRRAR